MSVHGFTVHGMSNLVLAAAVLAGLEINPGQPSDVTRLVRTPALRRSLLGNNPAEAYAFEPLVDFLLTYRPADRRAYWENVLEQVSRQGTRVVVAGDSPYPEMLELIWDAPPLLFLRGDLGCFSADAVAVVGSRDTSPEVLRATHDVSRELAGAGASVVSGLAVGVDTAAHEGALAGAGRTVAVLGGGLDRLYPPQNSGLARRIAASGAVVSQFPPQAPPTKTTFLLRNRVIAGLARTSIVMAATARSGSRHEATCAVEYGRRVLLWAPATAQEPWAQRMVDAGEAAFVATTQEAVTSA